MLFFTSFPVTACAFHWGWNNKAQWTQCSGNLHCLQTTLQEHLSNFCAELMESKYHLLALRQRSAFTCDEVSLTSGSVPRCKLTRYWSWHNLPFGGKARINFDKHRLINIFFSIWSISHVVGLLIDCKHLVKDSHSQSEWVKASLYCM